MEGASESWRLITKEKYTTILTTLICICNGEPFKLLRSIYPRIYKWCKNYTFIASSESFILVARPHDVIDFAIVDENVNMDTGKRITYFEAAYSDIKRAHGQDHTKGCTLYACLGEYFENIGQELCKMFTNMCPICITRLKRNWLVAGIKPIINHSFGTQGQVNLIIFQSMPNGEFCFLMNCIDHGVKILFSIPLTWKRVICIAVALLEIFTAIGPPMILQLDNGNEFNMAATTRKQVGEYHGELVRLTDLELTEIITEVRRLWPKCWMVRGSPRHSPSNGGVERVNRTMQEKLRAWMKDCQSREWMIGCRLMVWQYNTQNNCTIGDIPYCLVFGQLPCDGISAFPLDASVLIQLATEAQLNCVCNYVGKVEVLDNKQQWLRLLTMCKRQRQPITTRFRTQPTTPISTSLWWRLTTLRITTLLSWWVTTLTILQWRYWRRW